jgi:geranylgeranyl pyrophosphate synthase
LDNDLLRSIWQRIELSWSDTGANPEYVSFARLALSGERHPGEAANQDSSRWSLLPGLCCQAAGGEPHWADDVAAAWLLFYLAADLMDSVEDQDQPDSWWADYGPAAALNVATGLFFAASRSLNRLYGFKRIESCAGELIEDFHTGFIRMSGGQYQDMTISEPSLEQYWKIAENKSGVFFSLACRSGARLATADKDRLDNFAGFGNHLGVLIQVLDDLDDLRGLSVTSQPQKSSVLFHSLPVVYALDVSPPHIRNKLRECLLEASHDPGASHQAYELIEGSGVVFYIMTEIERHKQIATDCLSQVEPRSPAGEKLGELISRLDSA